MSALSKQNRSLILWGAIGVAIVGLLSHISILFWVISHSAYYLVFWLSAAAWVGWIRLALKKYKEEELEGAKFLISLFLLFLFPPGGLAFLSYEGHDGFVRGSTIAKPKDLEKALASNERGDAQKLPLLEIGGIKIPNSFENTGFCFLGSPGTGKSQAIKRIVQILLERDDFRVLCLDRNAEMLELFCQPDHLLFNPSDGRSVSWSHSAERGIRPEVLASAMVPDTGGSDNQFFTQAARSLLADIYEKAESNQGFTEFLGHDLKRLKSLLAGGMSASVLGSEKTASGVLATMKNGLRFYRDLPPVGDFSFFEWGREDDPRWLWLPIFERDSDLFKPLYSSAFELVLRGLLENERRNLKTAIIIDELAALNKLGSLRRLVSEGRKFGATLILGTQIIAQLVEIYGPQETKILLQGTQTKLFLRCLDSEDAERCADMIGKQDRVDKSRGTNTNWENMSYSTSTSEQFRDGIYIITPSEIQDLPNLVGILKIGGFFPASVVELEYQKYPALNERFVPKEANEIKALEF